MRPDVPKAIKIVRGADFRRRISVPALAESYDGLTSQARIGATVADLAVRPLDGLRAVEIHATAEQTAQWAPGLVPCSLRMTAGGEVAHTETFYIHVLPEVTRNV